MENERNVKMINKKFMTKRNELIKKYWNEVTGISNENGSDVGVSFEMLLANVKNRKEGLTLYKGAENVDYNALEKDIAELDKLRRVK